MFEITEEIDHHTTEKIRRRADYEIQRYMPRKAIFDFSSVSFMDSAGIGLIIGRYKLLSMLGGELEIVNVKPNVEKILHISGILKIISICKKEIV
ncbi:MAG: anti-sigma factor antagonist [Oscillospiraceae bacterium]|nr:anti-sigma factor antagonist [Oscillospiraceae bacterium]